MAGAGSTPPSSSRRGGNTKNKIVLYAFGLSILAVVHLSLQQSRLLWRATTTLSPYSAMTTIVSEWQEAKPNDDQDERFPSTVEVGMTSLDRLLQHAAASDIASSSIACIPTNETTMCDEDSSNDEVLYVNCAATQRENPAFVTAAPLSLLQCRDLLWSEMGMLNDEDGENVVTVIPRNDLFLTSSSLHDTNATLTLPSLTPLGTIHFHARPDSNTTSVQQNVTSEIEWFANRMIQYHQAAYYAVLGKSLAEAYGCVLEPTNGTSDEGEEYDSMYLCPPHPESDSSGSIWKPPESLWDTVRPVMYQWPQQQQAEQPPPIRYGNVDPVTPSVAAFRHAFIDMRTGRLLLHIPQPPSSNCSCHTNVTRHRQVLMQLNQCNELHAYERHAFLSTALRKGSWYQPFVLHVPSTTLAHNAGAYRYYDKAIVIAATWSVEYFHTVVENLPRLLLLRDFILALPDQSIPIVALISYRETPFLKFFADIWGMGDRLVFVGLDLVVYADTMYIPEPTPCLSLQPIMAQAYSSAIHNVLREQPVNTDHSPFIPALHADAAASTLPVNTVNATETMQKTALDNNDDTAADWIVVIRRRYKRYLRNHDDMMAALTAALPNEKWYVFDDEGQPNYSSPGVPQWQVFKRAKLVVAPHGAGLANLLACRSNIDVVEMLGAGRDSELCFLHLSLALGHRHHLVHMINLEEGERRSYEADIEQVVHVVTSIVQSESSTMSSSPTN
jgi:Glycosyltransferase 61